MLYMLDMYQISLARPQQATRPCPLSTRTRTHTVSLRLCISHFFFCPPSSLTRVCLTSIGPASPSCPPPHTLLHELVQPPQSVQRTRARPSQSGSVQHESCLFECLLPACPACLLLPASARDCWFKNGWLVPALLRLGSRWSLCVPCGRPAGRGQQGTPSSLSSSTYPVWLDFFGPHVGAKLSRCGK